MMRVEKYGRRTFAVYEADALLAVVCYRKGAEAIRLRIDELRKRVADLEARLEAAASAPSPPSHGIAADAPSRPLVPFECDCLTWDEHMNCVTTGKPFRVAPTRRSEGRDPAPSEEARESADGSVRPPARGEGR